MFKNLEDINSRPDPFDLYTAEDLWNDKHTSEQMLAYHLNTGVDVSSRRGEFIDQSVEWIGTHFNVDADTRIADFGCGPGLYASRLANYGAGLTGIDLCALSPLQRMSMLTKFYSLLLPGGFVLLDVYSLNAYNLHKEANSYEANLHNGFWSADEYYGFSNTFKYDDAKVALDKYTIVEAERVRTVHNWLQHFSSESLRSEFEEAGFLQHQLYGDVAGAPFDESASEFAIVAWK